ncbi:MAG: hypothetical protein HS113_06775 [Verrucomicrobiales bacterium]|nr:hypothetical protein [Verrucomicrobiales bacterium]
MKTMRACSCPPALRSAAARGTTALIIAVLGGNPIQGEDTPRPALTPESPPATHTAPAESPAAGTPEGVVPAPAASAVSAPAPLGELSPLVREVIQMSEAGVSANVIQAYVEASESLEQLSAPDLIALKTHGIADDLVTGMVQRSAKARALDARQKADAVARLVAARNARSGGVDPESYDYFRLYYLQPRALAAAYERLGPYARPVYAPGWYGRYGPPPTARYRYPR